MKQSKEALRAQSKLIRAELHKSGRILKVSAKIVRQVLNNKEFKSSKHVLLFYPKAGEVDLLGLLECSEKTNDKTFYLPRTNSEGGIDVCRYNKDDTLLTSKYGIEEPVCEALKDLSVLDIVFVPALCADKECHRIGYGRGYYDNFFKSNKDLKAKKIIVIPSEMTVEKIDTELHDVACDIVLTQA